MFRNISIFLLIMIICCSCNNQEVPKIPTVISYEISPVLSKYQKENNLEDGTRIIFVMKNNEDFDIDLPHIHIDFFDKNGNKVASSGGETLFSNDDRHGLWFHTFFRRNDLTPFEGKVYLEDPSVNYVHWVTSKVTIEDLSFTSSIYYPTFIEYCEQEKSFAEYTQETIYYPTRDFFIETKSINKISDDYFSEYEINARITFFGENYSTEIEPVALIYGKNHELIGIEECFPYSDIGVSLYYKESHEFTCEFVDFGNKYNTSKMDIEWVVQGLIKCQYDFTKPDTLLIKLSRALFGNVISDNWKETLIENSESKNNCNEPQKLDTKMGFFI